MIDESANTINNKAWLTSKVRIYAEKRYRRYEMVSHVLLCWLSLSVIAGMYSRVIITATQTDLFDIYTTILSVFVFIFSVIVFGFRFGETAFQFRQCYLELQKLTDDNSSNQVKNEHYHGILAGYKNHSDSDYDTLTISRTLFEKKNLWGADMEEISWTYPQLARYCLRALVFWGTTFIFFGLGCGTYYIIYLQL